MGINIENGTKTSTRRTGGPGGIETMRDKGKIQLDKAGLPCE
jgi:hypothetical protein